jgi:hypothetical protein
LEVWSPLDSDLDSGPQRRTVCQISYASRPLPALLRLASPSSFVQRSSLLLPHAPCFVLLAWHQSGPVFPVVVGGVFAVGSLPLRRRLPHVHNAACLRRVKASSPNAARSVQKEPVPPTSRWGREGLPWLEPAQDNSHP